MCTPHQSFKDACVSKPNKSTSTLKLVPVYHIPILSSPVLKFVSQCSAGPTNTAMLLDISQVYSALSPKSDHQAYRPTLLRFTTTSFHSLSILVLGLISRQLPRNLTSRGFFQSRGYPLSKQLTIILLSK